MSHQYLDQVHQCIRQARLQAANDRQRAILAGRQRLARFGADPAGAAARSAALDIPPPSPVGAALSHDVVTAATSAFQTAGRATAVQEGLSAVDAAQSPDALDAARAAQPAYGLAGFDAGVAIAHGAALSRGRVPRALRPSERAGWLAVFGLEGAPAETKRGVIGSAVQAASSGSPAAQGFVKGAAAAVDAVQKGQSPVIAAGSYTPQDAWTGAAIYGGGSAAVVGGLTLLGVYKTGLLALTGLTLGGAGLALAAGYALGNRYAVALVNAGKQAVSPTPAALAASATEASATADGAGAGGGPAVSSPSAPASTTSV